MTRWAIAIHGGAGRLAQRKTVDPGRRPYDDAIARSLAAGAAVLRRGGGSVRAVTAATVVLEDCELFNAGKGAALCRDGSVELSAAVMSGRSGAVGAMVGLKRTKNPILAARSIMGHSHCLLFGPNGDEYAASRGLEQVDSDYFMTARRRRQWRRVRDTESIHLDHAEDEAHGTVGAVARDSRGHLAAATSTGGLVNQLPGRVGDSPVAGAGTWADSRCAVSATGTGDVFFRVAFARRVADLIELAGLAPDEAARSALKDVRTHRGQGGCIAVDAEGSITAEFISPQMVRGGLAHGGPMWSAIGPSDRREIEPGSGTR